MFFCCSCLIAPLRVSAVGCVWGSVLRVLSSPEIVRKIKRAGGVLGLNGNASPVCGTEQGGESTWCQGSRFSLSKAITLANVVKGLKKSCVTLLSLLPAPALLPASPPCLTLLKSGCAELSPFLHTVPLALKETLAEFPLSPPACCKHCIFRPFPGTGMAREEGTGSLLVTGLALRAEVGFGRRELPAPSPRLVFLCWGMPELSAGGRVGCAQALCEVGQGQQAVPGTELSVAAADSRGGCSTAGRPDWERCWAGSSSTAGR